MLHLPGSTTSTRSETERQDVTQGNVEIMRGDRFCMLTSVGEQGRLQSHPMTPQEVTDDGDVWFFIDSSSNQARFITAEKRVKLAFADSSTWLSVAGHGELRNDRAKIDELWNPIVEAWFPDGPESDRVALLFVEADSTEYWNTPGDRVASALSFAKTKLLGGSPSSGGENVSTEL